MKSIAMAGYGLDDSDFEEFLESSSDDEAVVVPPPLLPPAAPAVPRFHIFLSSTAWRGPAAGASADACGPIPPSRWGPRGFDLAQAVFADGSRFLLQQQNVVFQAAVT